MLWYQEKIANQYVKNGLDVFKNILFKKCNSTTCNNFKNTPDIVLILDSFLLLKQHRGLIGSISSNITRGENDLMKMLY